MTGLGYLMLKSHCREQKGLNSFTLKYPSSDSLCTLTTGGGTTHTLCWLVTRAVLG